jgi:hypothetical protein
MAWKKRSWVKPKKYCGMRYGMCLSRGRKAVKAWKKRGSSSNKWLPYGEYKRSLSKSKCHKCSGSQHISRGDSGSLWNKIVEKSKLSDKKTIRRLRRRQRESSNFIGPRNKPLGYKKPKPGEVINILDDDDVIDLTGNEVIDLSRDVDPDTFDDPVFDRQIAINTRGGIYDHIHMADLD